MTTDPHKDAPLLQGVQTGALGLSSVGRYGLRRELGSGPSGTVYVGYDPETGRDVAVNLMAAHEAGFEAVARSCVADEARAWAQLDHPNLVRVHDVGYYRDPRTGRTGVYVVRELVPGIDLHRWLAARPRFSGSQSWTPVVRIFCTVGKALAAAHARRLVHRRFAPTSVVIDYDGGVKLLDFGTFHASPLHEADEPAPRYDAPELDQGLPADAASDQYSYCAALRHAVSRATHGRVPSPIDRVLRRGMDPHPARRFPSMIELVDQLQRAARPWWQRPVAAAFTAAAAVSGAALWFSSVA